MPARKIPSDMTHTAAMFADTKHEGIVYVKALGRGGLVSVYQQVGSDLTKLNVSANTLAVARDRFVAAVGTSIGEHVKALDPMRYLTHAQADNRSWLSLCEQKGGLLTSRNLNELTCPYCLALIREAFHAQVKALGADAAIDHAHEEIEARRTLKALD